MGNREIDIAVAEALGLAGPCDFDPDEDIEYTDHGEWHCEKCDRYGGAYGTWECEATHDRFVQHYSTDIAAAWAVVRWMNREKKWIVRVNAMWDGSADVSVHSDQISPSHWSTVADEDADTVPDAICLAFLKAMGVKAPE